MGANLSIKPIGAGHRMMTFFTMPLVFIEPEHHSAASIPLELNPLELNLTVLPRPALNKLASLWYR